MSKKEYIHFYRVSHISHWQPAIPLRCFEISWGTSVGGVEGYCSEELPVLGMETTVEDSYHGPRMSGVEDYSLRGLGKAYNTTNPVNEKIDKLLILDEVGVHRIDPCTDYDVENATAYVVVAANLTDSQITDAIDEAIEYLEENATPPPPVTIPDPSSASPAS